MVMVMARDTWGNDMEWHGVLEAFLVIDDGSRCTHVLRLITLLLKFYFYLFFLLRARGSLQEEKDSMRLNLLVVQVMRKVHFRFMIVQRTVRAFNSFSHTSKPPLFSLFVRFHLKSPK